MRSLILLALLFLFMDGFRIEDDLPGINLDICRDAGGISYLQVDYFEYIKCENWE